jgi:hypothetical protein
VKEKLFMVHVEIPRRRPWAGIGLLAAVALGALVAVVNIYAGLLLIALAGAGVGIVALAGTRPALAASAFTGSAAKMNAWPAVAQRTIYDDEGVSHVAIAVPAASADGYQTVWTTDGYVLVDTAGKVVYKLKQ